MPASDEACSHSLRIEMFMLILSQVGFELAFRSYPPRTKPFGCEAPLLRAIRSYYYPFYWPVTIELTLTTLLASSQRYDNSRESQSRFAFIFTRLDY